MLKVMLVFLLLGLAPTAVAGDTSAAAGGECDGDGDDAYSVIDILDPDAPAAIKARNLDVVKRLAMNPDCMYTRYLLGLLHRHGSDLPGNPVAKDVAVARGLIEEYALAGNVQGFADLAEMALEQKQAREAMQWTQIYLYLVTTQEGTLEGFDRSGYNADLLQRAYGAWRGARLPTGKDAIEASFNAYLQPRKAELDARLLEAQEETLRPSDQSGGADQLRIKSQKKFRSFSGPSKPGYAIYLLEVQPNGKVSRIVVETFAPLPEHARYLRPLVEGTTFHPFTGNEPIVARLPMQYGYTDGVKIKKQKP